MRYTIFINEAKFTADEHTTDTVIEALKAAGFTYDEKTDGWIEPGFYDKAVAA